MSLDIMKDDFEIAQHSNKNCQPISLDKNNTLTFPRITPSAKAANFSGSDDSPVRLGFTLSISGFIPSSVLL